MGLEQVYSVAFRIKERRKPPDIGYLHRFTRQFSARCFNLLHVRLDIIYLNSHSCSLGDVTRFLVKTSVDRAGCLWHVLVRFGGSNKNEVSHLGAQLLGLPAKYARIKANHALPILCGHFKMDYWIHDVTNVLQFVKYASEVRHFNLEAEPQNMDDGV